jgi:sodium/bile acid cotransporter 7
MLLKRLNSYRMKGISVAVVSLIIGAAVYGYAGFFSQGPQNDSEAKQRVYSMYEDYRKSFPEAPEMHPQEAMGLMGTAEVVFVDTRSEEERRVSMLPGAVAHEEFLRNPGAYSDGTVVAYCTIGYRSGLLARDMLEKGRRVHNLEGGILGWVHEGGKVYDEGEETRRIHVYGRRWNYPPQSYEAVW